MKYWGKILMCAVGSAIAAAIIYLAALGVAFLVSSPPAKKQTTFYLWVMNHE